MIYGRQLNAISEYLAHSNDAFCDEVLVLSRRNLALWFVQPIPGTEHNSPSKSSLFAVYYCKRTPNFNCIYRALKLPRYWEYSGGRQYLAYVHRSKAVPIPVAFVVASRMCFPKSNFCPARLPGIWYRPLDFFVKFLEFSGLSSLRHSKNTYKP